MGYPLLTFALGVQMHLAPRVLKAYDHYELCEPVSNSIIAGCTQSTYWAKVMLFAVVAGALEANPYQELRTFVDDVAQRVTLPPKGSYITSANLPIVDQAVRVATDLGQRLEEAGCVISSKTTVVARRLMVRKAIQKKLKARGIRVAIATHAKDLGVGTTCGVRRWGEGGGAGQHPRVCGERPARRGRNRKWSNSPLEHGGRPLCD